jgi:lipopolysaccharide/colanic/teichoic acid biosynthesis glycosyltransferase
VLKRNCPKLAIMNKTAGTDSSQFEVARGGVGMLAAGTIWRGQGSFLQKGFVAAPDASVGVRQEVRSSGLPIWKRMLDLALILLVSPALLLIGGAVALLVRCGSRGPVLFRQRRVGYQGREFTCFKFRTMRVNAETDSHRKHFTQLMSSDAPMTKLDAKRDPRLVPLGAALRAAGLDELPQLLNVLRGEMSIVGPRPCIPYEYEHYASWQKRRFDAVPGLTGLWQVSGKNRTTFDQMIRLDIQYSERASLKLDLEIILKTVPALATQCLDIRAAKRGQAEPARAVLAKAI